MTILRQRMIEALRARKYPSATQEIYVDHVARFARFFSTAPDRLGPKHIGEYQLYLLKEKSVARETLLEALSALRFLYHSTLAKDWRIEPIAVPAITLRQRMIQDMRIRGRAKRTAEDYIRQVEKLAKYFRKSPHLLGAQHVRQFLVHLVEEKHASRDTMNKVACALRFLYKVTLDRPWMIEYIPFPPKPKRLPKVLSVDEIWQFFAAITKLRDRAAILTAYAAGLRLSEIIHLKVTDIDSRRMVIRVEQGKGRKDRYVMLSEQLLETLRAYYKSVRPRDWLFPGKKPGKPMSQHTLENAFAKARKRSGITKPFTLHTLRHSFATHLLESETNIRTIQLLLGHKCLGSTSIYTHVSKNTVCSTKSPLDSLYEKKSIQQQSASESSSAAKKAVKAAKSNKTKTHSKTANKTKTKTHSKTANKTKTKTHSKTAKKKKTKSRNTAKKK